MENVAVAKSQKVVKIGHVTGVKVMWDHVKNLGCVPKGEMQGYRETV